MQSNRVLIIGLDGATWDVLDPWIKDGTLPNLAKLRQSGSWGSLFSTIPPLTAPAWSTFVTGKRPGKHGVFHFIKLFDEDRGSGDKPQIVNARSIKSSTLWDIVAHHGRKVGVMNVPMSYPPRPMNGLMITCFLTPRHAPVFTYPPELSGQLTDYVIDLERFVDLKPYQGPRDEAVIAPTLTMMQEFRDMTDKRANTALSLMASNPWDVFMVVFTSTDRMGHYLWPYHRTPNPADDPKIQQLCQAVRDHYIRLDEIIGQLLHQAGPETTLIMMSDHGMGLRAAKRVHFNNWMQKQGWLVAAKPGNNHNGPNPDDWLRKLGIPRDKVGRLVRRIPGLMRTRMVRTATQSRSLEIDTGQSQAYCVPMYDMLTGVKINQEGERKEALRQEISQRLEQLVDPETGEHIVQQIFKGSDYYQGPHAENIPDMIVMIKPEYSCGHNLGHYSSFVTKMSAPLNRGNHRMNGIFMAYGPQVQANPSPLDNLMIEDVTPTILYLMGLPVPSDMDGRVLTEIVPSAVLTQQPIEVSPPIGFWPNPDSVEFIDEGASAEDEEAIREQLRALGYFE